MARDLRQKDEQGKDVIQELVLFDPIGQTQITLFYRMPTNKERILFETDSVDRKGKKVKDTSHYSALKWGANILMGFKEGDFANGEDIISSDESSDNYYPEWKKLVLQSAGDLVQILGRQIFQGSALSQITKAQAQDEDEGKADEDDTVPAGLEGVNDSEPENKEADPDPLA